MGRRGLQWPSAMQRPLQGGGGSRWGEEVGQIWQLIVLFLPLPPGDVPGSRGKRGGGKSWDGGGSK